MMAALLEAVATRRRRVHLAPVLWSIIVALFIIDMHLIHMNRGPATAHDFRSESKRKQDIIQSLFERKLSDLMLLENSAKKSCPNFVEELKKLTWEYFPHIFLSTEFLLRTRTESQADTCGEEYRGSLYGHPWYREGFVQSSKCNPREKQPISRLVTIALMQRSIDEKRTIDLLRSIRDYNRNIPVILGTEASYDFRKKLERMFDGVKTVEVDQRGAPRHAYLWNAMIESVDTPYTLVARDLFHFSDLARLERQIHVISSTTTVGVAGGAFRNESGFWKVGCYQSQMRNYVLKYTQGYKFSALDCMVCDFLEGPFVVKTSIARKIKFRAKMFTHVLFEDWFLQLQRANVLVMNCPDALYFKSGVVEGFDKIDNRTEKKSWVSLAKVWKINRIEFPLRDAMEFDCAELEIQCRGWRSLLLPTCCLRKYTKSLRTVDEFAKQMNLEYEIIAGTVMGAVKLGNILPWDLDGDISYEAKDHEVFRNHSEYFIIREFTLKFDQYETYFKLYLNKIYFEMWGDYELSRSQWPASMRNISTRLKLNGMWIKVVRNPGLHVRNRYGPDTYKHAPHWINSGRGTSWMGYSPGSWLPCRIPSHHACLERYPTDGSEELLPDHLIKENLGSR